MHRVRPAQRRRRRPQRAHAHAQAPRTTLTTTAATVRGGGPPAGARHGQPRLQLASRDPDARARALFVSCMRPASSAGTAAHLGRVQDPACRGRAACRSRPQGLETMNTQ
jgi:hypothetical protein